jgi:myo-inositol 2-dehydrogenase / D-chiro-inositol 1-dehydrogenase
MTVRVGVIGTGIMGRAHIQRMTHVLPGARVVAVSDVDQQRAAAAVANLPGCRIHATGVELIADDSVDAVAVTSWGSTHEEFVLAAIAAGKQVFCEKPLATTLAACRRIIDAETAAGSRMVMVGFMWRYDAAHMALKQVVEDGGLGAPLLVHCAHRNASVPASYIDEMAINDTAVHEIDMCRWLLGEGISAVRVLSPRRNSQAPAHLRDPLLVLLETSAGTLIDVEVSVNIGYGYDIRCEIIGELGTASLADAGDVVVRRDGCVSIAVPNDWRQRFRRAYEAELDNWLSAVAAGGTTGPTAWDGYAATAVTDACLAALRTGDRVPVVVGERPALYAKSG